MSSTPFTCELTLGILEYHQLTLQSILGLEKLKSKNGKVDDSKSAQKAVENSESQQSTDPQGGMGITGELKGFWKRSERGEARRHRLQTAKFPNYPHSQEVNSAIETIKNDEFK